MHDENAPNNSIDDDDPINAFSSQHASLRLAWDSTTFRALMKCPRYYYYTYVEGWQPKRGKPALEFGILFHATLELYDKLMAKGISHEEAQLHATRYALVKSWDSILRDIEDRKRDRLAFVRACVWYMEHFKEDPIESYILQDGEPAIELSFRIAMPLKAQTNEEYIYCGHLDKVGRLQGDTYVIDRKSTGGQFSDNYFNKFNTDAQMSGYNMGARILLQDKTHGVIIDAAQLLVSGVRFARSITTRHEDQITEFMGDLTTWLKMAEQFAVLDYWPHNWDSCDKYGKCDFCNVCSKPESTRQIWLRDEFEQQDLWNPLESRDA